MRLLSARRPTQARDGASAERRAEAHQRIGGVEGGHDQLAESLEIVAAFLDEDRRQSAEADQPACLPVSVG